jgi:uncharacterized protein
MNDPSDIDLTPLWSLAAEQFALGAHTIHGPDHWQRVERNALRIAAATNGADVLVVRLFAVLHDSKRLNESHDPEHGLRAAQWAQQLRAQAQICVTEVQFELLSEACIWHDKGKVSDDLTIGACWDADRLDLTRLGVRVLPELMSTKIGKELARVAR